MQEYSLTSQKVIKNWIAATQDMQPWMPERIIRKDVESLVMSEAQIAEQELNEMFPADISRVYINATGNEDLLRQPAGTYHCDAVNPYIVVFLNWDGKEMYKATTRHRLMRHEMVHHRQYMRGDLLEKDGKVFWKGEDWTERANAVHARLQSDDVTFEEMMAYVHLPWEYEAFEMDTDKGRRWTMVDAKRTLRKIKARLNK